MKKYFHYFIVLFIMGILLLILMETVLMPIYVRSGNTQKLIDVQNLHLQVALTRLDSEGLRGVVVDTVLTNNAIKKRVKNIYLIFEENKYIDILFFIKFIKVKY